MSRDADPDAWESWGFLVGPLVRDTAVVFSMKMLQSI